jgi:hypothetical protein
MEKAVMSRPTEEADDLGALKVPIMRTLARHHECDTEMLFSEVDASELDVHDILTEMVLRNEVAASPRQQSGGRRDERFALTLKGWGEYMKVLGSIYELAE